jgi:WD40 repeat protein
MSPYTVCLSPGGRYIACGEAEFDPPPWGTAVKIFEVSTGKEVRGFPWGDTNGQVTGIDFSPDGRLLAWVGSGGFSVEDISDIADPPVSVRPERKLITTWGRIKFQ